MNWQAVLNDRSLQDLPYRIELNARGQVVLSLWTNGHSALTSEIAFVLRQPLGKTGRCINKPSISTHNGVSVCALGWVSRAFLERVGLMTPFPTAPEICVEIMDASNAQMEINERAVLYFDAGALEVWLCSLEGHMRFLKPGAELERSELVPDFPQQLEP